MTVRWTVRADGDQSAQFALRPSPIRVAKLKLNTCGFSSFGRAPPCQGGGGGFEPRNPLQKKNRTRSGTVFLLDGNGAFVAPKRRLAPSNKSQQSDLCVTFATANSGEYFRTKTKILSVIPLHSKSVFADPRGLLFYSNDF